VAGAPGLHRSVAGNVDQGHLCAGTSALLWLSNTTLPDQPEWWRSRWPTATGHGSCDLIVISTSMMLLPLTMGDVASRMARRAVCGRSVFGSVSVA